MISFFTQFAAGCNNPKVFIDLLPTWYQYLPKAVDPVTKQCEVQFQLMQGGVFNGAGLLLIALGIVDILIRVAALVAVGFVIYGGFRYMASQGSPEGTKAAQSTVINAIAGLVIAILAAAIVSFIGNSVKG